MSDESILRDKVRETNMDDDIRRCIDVVGTAAIPGMQLGKGATITDDNGTLIATLNTADWTVAEVHAFAAYLSTPL